LNIDLKEFTLKNDKMNNKTKKKLEVTTAVKDPPAKYDRNRDIPSFFGEPMFKGSYTQIDPIN